MTQSSAITQALKTFMKGKGITYRALAKRLGLTESAMKRAFSLSSFSLQRLDEVCQVLEVDFLTLAKLSHRAGSTIEQLNPKQEEALAKDEKLFTLFYLLISGVPYKQLTTLFNFTEPEVLKLTERLVGLELLAEIGNQKFVSRVSQSVLWERGGALFRKYDSQVKTEFFDVPFNELGQSLWYVAGNISQASHKRIESRFNAVFEEVREIITADESIHRPKDLTNITIICGLRPWVFSVIQKHLRNYPRE